MDVKDRERLALSTGLALVGYAIIYVLLAGLNWPTDVAVRSISAPVSVYVDLQGTSPQEPAGAPQVTPTQPEKPAPQASPPTPEKATTNTSNQTSTTTVAPPAVASAQSKPATRPTPAETPQPSAPAPNAVAQSSTSAQPSTSSSTASSQSPPSTPIPSSMTSSAGPTSTPSGASQPRAGTSAQSGAPLSGTASPKPGVNYPPEAGADTAPPQGSGGTGSQSNQGKAQVYQGPESSKSGSIFDPLLASSAGTSTGGGGSSSASGAGSGGANASSSGASGGTQAAGGQAEGAAGSFGGTAGRGAGAGNAAGTQAGGAGGSVPKIEWKGNSSTREVDYRPPKLVIPKQYLSEIPPKITLTIDFQVTPLGTVNVLNVTPSLGYPQLDDLVKEWMGKWRFQPIRGDQTAEGTLEYVIQADTAG